MHIERLTLRGDSAGTQRSLAVYRFGQAGAGPKVYLQAALHADEMPGVLVLQHLLPLLETAEEAGRILGEVVVVPLANPIGFAQWTHHKPLGRFEAETMQNFNRGYPDLAALIGDGLEGRLTGSATQNRDLIRAAMRNALDAETTGSDLAELRLALLRLACDADYVLDLHCDHEAVLHLYATPARADDTALLCRCTGAKAGADCRSVGRQRV